MATRTLGTTSFDGQPGVSTVNGAPTWTSSVWDLVSDIDYLSIDRSIVNAHLLKAVLEVIKGHPRFWRQSNWREMVGLYQVEPDDLLDLAPALQHGSCGTTMCFAGWAAELVKADWVIDASLIAMAKEGLTPGTVVSEHNDRTYTAMLAERHFGGMESMILVRRDWWYSGPQEITLAGTDHRWRDIYDGFSRKHTAITESLVERGFSETTHEVVSIASFARAVLGIREDPLMLFGAGNILRDIERSIEAYITWGADLSGDQIRFVINDIRPLAEFTPTKSYFGPTPEGNLS